ncbi:immunoglobulin-like domain-containing protein [Listeria monocytogenes]
MKKNASKLLVGLVAINVLANVPLTAVGADAAEVTPKVTAEAHSKKAVKAELKSAPINLLKNPDLDLNFNTKSFSDWDYYDITNASVISASGFQTYQGWVIPPNMIYAHDSAQTYSLRAKTNYIAFGVDSGSGNGEYATKADLHVAARQGVSTIPGQKYRFTFTKIEYSGYSKIGGTAYISNNSSLTDNIKKQALSQMQEDIVIDFVAENTTTYIGLGNDSDSARRYSALLYSQPSLIQMPNTPKITPMNTKDTNVVVSGYAEALISIKLPDGTTMSKTADAEGKAAFNVPKQEAGTVITATQEAYGSVSDPATLKVGLAAPTITTINDKSTSATVTGDAGADLTLTLPDGSRTTKTANAQGQATFSVSGLAAGQVIQASQSKNGQTSPLASTTVQATALNAPTIAPFTTADTQLVVTGEAGAKIMVTLADGTEMNKTADASGKATFNIGKQELGEIIEATQTGSNGKVSEKASIKVTEDQTPTLGAPTIDAVNTASTTVTVNGVVGANVSLKLPDGSILTKVVDASGKAVIAIPKQSAGAVLTATQTGSNGKASAAASVTVTSATLASPTINDYYASGAYVTGKAPTGASKIALYVDNQLVRYGAIDSNGNYQIYAADNAKMNTAGTAFQVVALDSDGNLGTKANSTVKARLTAPSINDYYTTDVYAKGTAAGASKVTLYINGKAVRTAAVNSNGSYSIYTGDQASLTAAGATFQISATNAAGVESTKTTGTVKSKLAAPVINKYVATDAYARGTASAGSKQVVLYVDGKAVRTASVNENGTYAIYTGDQAKLTTAGSTFQISSKDAAGNESPKATGTVLSVLAAPVIAPYYTSDVYATGTTTSAATKVALYVDGKFVRYATVTDGKYSIYTGDQAMLRTAGNTFQIAAVDANGIIGSMTTGTVLVDNRVDSKLTANDYNLTVDQNVTGEAGKDITRVKIYVNGELKRQTNVVDGSYGIYAKDVITKANDEVVIVGYDTQGYERNRVTVPVKNEAPKTYNLTANEYNLAKDENVTGTSDTGITRVQLVVNDVVVRATATANGSYAIYAEDQIKLGDKVEIVGLDSSNIARKTVTVSVVNNAPVTKNITVDDYTIGADNITGTFDPEIKKVQLFINGSFVRQAAISGTSFTVYAADKVTSDSQTVEMVGFDTSGAEIARQAVNVK